VIKDFSSIFANSRSDRGGLSRWVRSLYEEFRSTFLYKLVNFLRDWFRHYKLHGIISN